MSNAGREHGSLPAGAQRSCFARVSGVGRHDEMTPSEAVEVGDVVEHG